MITGSRLVVGLTKRREVVEAAIEKWSDPPLGWMSRNFGSWWGDPRMISTTDNTYRIWGYHGKGYIQVHFSNIHGWLGTMTYKAENLSQEDVERLLKGQVPE